MQQRIIFVILFLTATLTVKPQSFLDSVIGYSGNTSPTVDKISQVFFYCERKLIQSPDSVFQVLEITKKFLIENENIKRWGEYSYYLANYYYLIENMDSAQFYYQQALEHLKPTLSNEKVGSFINLSKIALLKNDASSAKASVNKANSIARLSDNAVLRGKVNQQQAFIYSYEDNFPEAANFYQKAINEYRSAYDTLNIALVYNDIARMYSSIGNYPLSIDYLEKAEYYLIKINKVRNLAQNQLQMGKVYLYAAKYTNALKKFETAEILNIKINDIANLSEVYNFMGKSYEKLRDFRQSEFYLNKAMDLKLQIEDEKGQAVVLESLGDLYVISENIQKAILYYQKSLTLLEQDDVNEIEWGLYQKLSSNYAVLGNFRMAYKYQTLFNTVDRNRINWEYEHLIKRKEDKLKTALYNAESRSQVLQKEWSKIMDNKKEKKVIYKLIVAIQLIGLLLFVYLFIKRRYRIKLHENNLKNTIKLQRERLEKNRLDCKKLKRSSEQIINIATKNMWEPFMVLEKLAHQIINDKDFDSAQFKSEKFDVDQLIMARNLLENVLFWANNQQKQLEFQPKLHPVNDLILGVIKMQTYRAKAKNIDIVFIPYAELYVYSDKNTTEVALRNIIENAIKFSTLNGDLLINVVNKQKYIEISVEDKGVGMTRDQINALFSTQKPYLASGTHGEKGLGLGLSLTKEFVERNGGALQITSSIARGTTVKLLLPVSFEKSLSN